jgi:hypothetical protein
MRVAKGDSFVAVCDIRHGLHWPEWCFKKKQACGQKASLEFP